MTEMVQQFFYESNNNSLLIKRESSDQKKKKTCTLKKMSFSEKYVAIIFSLNKFLVTECILKLVCFVLGICSTSVYSLKIL